MTIEPEPRMLLHDLCPACQNPLDEEAAVTVTADARRVYVCPTCRAECYRDTDKLWHLNNIPA
jgi:hypothetical protein